MINGDLPIGGGGIWGMSDEDRTVAAHREAPEEKRLEARRGFAG